jgi:diketogulonate reductase-like aldo/keto reductase
MPSELSDPLVVELAEKYGKTPAQVLLRHLTQEGVAVIPKSSTLHRVRENFKFWDFKMSYEDLERLRSLDTPKGRIMKFKQ